MTDRKTLLARLARWRDKLREVAARLARVRGSGDGEREAAAVEAAMLTDLALADAWAADGFRWHLLGEQLLAESAVTVEHARRHFFEGHGETPPLLVLDRLIDRLVTHRPQLDPAVLAANVQRRLFDGDGWRPWLASPTPGKTLLRILRWCASSTRRNDRLDLWTDISETPVEPEVRPTEPVEARERRALRAALIAALRALGPLDAELLHLTWMHELNELEIRWLVEKQNPIHHRITRAFERLVAGIARLRPELIDRPDPKALKASPPPQSERRQEASRDLRAQLADTVLPVAPARWQRFALVDQPAGTPDSRPKRTRLAPGDAAPDNGLLSDDERAAIALGWLYTCHWSAAETPADRRPRAARLAHLLAMGRPIDEIRADVIAATDDDTTGAERSALNLALRDWLVGELDISDRIARNWLGLPVTDPLDPEEA